MDLGINDMLLDTFETNMTGRKRKRIHCEGRRECEYEPEEKRRRLDFRYFPLEEAPVHENVLCQVSMKRPLSPRSQVSRSLECYLDDDNDCDTSDEEGEELNNYHHDSSLTSFYEEQQRPRPRIGECFQAILPELQPKRKDYSFDKREGENIWDNERLHKKDVESFIERGSKVLNVDPSNNRMSYVEDLLSILERNDYDLKRSFNYLFLNRSLIIREKKRRYEKEHEILQKFLDDDKKIEIEKEEVRIRRKKKEVNIEGNDDDDIDEEEEEDILF